MDTALIKSPFLYLNGKSI